jgi:alpha-N-acetylglucosaminidase
VELEKDIADKKSLDKDAFNRQIKDWEWKWVNSRKDYPQQASGNTVAQARLVYKKYWGEINQTP